MTLSFGRVLGPLEDDNLIEAINDCKQLVEEAPVVWNQNNGSLSQSEAYGVDGKPAKLSLLLKKPYCHSHQQPWSNGPLKDSTNSSALRQQRLQCFSKPVSSSEREKAGKGVVPNNTDTRP